jgi:hypothetical protein
MIGSLFLKSYSFSASISLLGLNSFGESYPCLAHIVCSSLLSSRVIHYSAMKRYVSWMRHHLRSHRKFNVPGST